MFKSKTAFSSFSVDNLAKAKEFYTQTLELKLDDETMGLKFELPGGGALFIYPKDNHQPATFTVLNFLVDTIDEAVDQLTSRGVNFERYPDMSHDEKGIVRSQSKQMGPDIAWFKDPAGNIIAVIASDIIN